MITTGAAMTLDVLVNRFFGEPPRVDFRVCTLARLPAVLEQLAPTTDLTLAAYHGRSLDGSGLAICASLPWSVPGCH